MHAADHPKLQGFAAQHVRRTEGASTPLHGFMPFVGPDLSGRQVRGFQITILFRPTQEASAEVRRRGLAQRGVSVAKLVRGGTEKKTSICAKLRSHSSPDPNGDEDVLQWLDELIGYGII